MGSEILGIEELRPGQAEGLRYLLAGKDVLAVMPTGAGKSLLYQLMSLVLPGVTVVVSPLIALIRDQVEKMRDKGVAVARFDSTLTTKQKREMMTLAMAPGGKLLLTTPERMADPEFRKVMAQASGNVGVSLFVVDEAHCVSQWGHDFRPAYLSLRQAIDELSRPQVLATTATAPPHVREDILHQLGVPKAKLVTTSFDRENLHFEVIPVPGEDEKKKVLLSLVKKLKRPGIVYCATVKAVEKLGEELSRHGIPVATYHGRMTKRERDEQHARFMEKRSKLVMVATNAFGLGVDKPDIRYVLHYHVPGSLEQYAQEAGRGGRDGKPARCVLLFSPDDVAIQEHFLQGTYPTRKQVMAVVDALTAWRGEDRVPTLAELAMTSHVGASRARTVLALLKEEGWVKEEQGGVFCLATPPPDRTEVAKRAKDYEKRRIADRRRLDALLAYVREEGCRNKVILEYLGEKGVKRCGRCDNDLRSAAEAHAAAVKAVELEHVIHRMTAEVEAEAEALPEGPALPKARRTRTRVVSLDVSPEAPAVPPSAVAEAITPALPEGAEAEEEVEPIATTAAELAAEEPVEGEITVLRRKKKPKPPREPKPKAAPQAEGKKRRRRRRRRKKGGRGALVTPPVAFTSPVLVIPPVVTPEPGGPQASVAVSATSAGLSAPPPQREGGPIIEYVRRPMRLAAAPVASATPHGAQGRHVRRPSGYSPAPGAMGKPPGQPGQPSPPGEGKRRRRRRKRRRGGQGPTVAQPPRGESGQALVGESPHEGVGGPSPLVSFWTTLPSGSAPPQGGASLSRDMPIPSGERQGTPGGPHLDGKRRRRRRRRRRRGHQMPQGAVTPGMQSHGPESSASEAQTSAPAPPTPEGALSATEVHAPASAPASPSDGEPTHPVSHGEPTGSK
ncbi:MAG: RecQ family ATP-dependent DNA helicase [Deltaproteobacteria bacterium]|nr:RecQ family ATP-dependent DNA helicase [Deltaproteobacteria bacterium]